MRLTALAAALALAAPAAAQAEPSAVLLGAMERAHQNVPAGAADYLLTLVSGPIRSELYVHRDEDGRWQVMEQNDAPLADLFQSMVIWPLLAAELRPGMTAADVAASQPGARYLGRETVDGRAAHVLMARIPGLTLEGMPMPDSARVFVDAETRQVLRVTAAAAVDSAYGGALIHGGEVDMDLTFSGYEPIDGATLPRRWRIVSRMRDNLSPAERKEMRDEMSAMATHLAGDTSPEAAGMRVLFEIGLKMLDGEPMDVTVQLDDVRVNAGRPAWADEDG